MAKVIGLDVPSKHYDTFHNLFGTAFWQDPEEKGTVIKKGSWKFPGYPYHPKFASPAQLYVRAIFKSATICWAMQPIHGGHERPDTGPIPREWWANEAHKTRTFAYRRFMSDTLMYKHRIGEPTWCEPAFIPFTYVDWEFPDTNYCESKNIIAFYAYPNRWRNIYIERPMEDTGKPFFHLYAYNTIMDETYPTFADVIICNWYEWDPCELTFNTQPTEDFHLSRVRVLGPGWQRWFVGDYNLFKIRIYFSIWAMVEPGTRGAMFCCSSLADDIDKRPYFGIE